MSEGGAWPGDPGQGEAANPRDVAERGGEVVIRLLANVKQVTIGPLIDRTIAKGALVYTEECDIYSRLVE
jgi:hypothetical protein